KYMVSIGALEYRAYKLGLLTFEENRYFYAKLNQKDYKKSEPFDEDIAIIRPGKIRSLLDLIFRNHLFSLNNILNDYYVDRSFLESLLGLENGFLEKYLEESTIEYFNTSNVIPLFTK
ncbi:helix-turn-helix domain-containing protein, partial [Listeria monocytogenes]|nr:transcriptional regulator [Listeria monocytogenes]